MKALVFAAGLGTRLRPVTDTIPKALVPVDGKPLLYHVVSKLKAAGIDRIVINVHHFPDSVIEEASCMPASCWKAALSWSITWT